MTSKKPILTIIPELGDAAIRRTPNGKCSVYDLITVVGGQKNPWDAWKRLSERYPEVLGKCEDFKFLGRGQRETPITDREGWAYILGLLPGVMGKRYRESAADLVVRYLDADITLADEVVDRNDNLEDLERHEARVRGKITRKRFTADLKARGTSGLGYAMCTNKVYSGLFGGTAKALKAMKGVKKNDSLRDAFTINELNQTSFTEDLAGKRVHVTQAWGNNQCAKDCHYVAKRVAAFAQDVVNI